VLKSPFGRGLWLGLGVADAITDGLADTEALDTADALAEGPDVPPPQPEKAMATIPPTISRFAPRDRRLMALGNVTLEYMGAW
jgi:hypothetical protein